MNRKVGENTDRKLGTRRVVERAIQLSRKRGTWVENLRKVLEPENRECRDVDDDDDLKASA